MRVLKCVTGSALVRTPILPASENVSSLLRLSDIGQDNEDILAEAGSDEEEIKRLYEAKILKRGR